MVPSLQKICEVPILVAISNHPDVKEQFSLLTKIRKGYYLGHISWEKAIDEKTSEILKDCEPILWSNFPRHLVKYILTEILRWAEYMELHFNLPLKFSQDFIKCSFFTPNGHIDKDKAARELVKEPCLNSLEKYQIACHFFLEDIIPNLWEELRNSEHNLKKILNDLGSKSPMSMWDEYLEQRKLAPEQNLPLVTHNFKKKVFSYGIEEKNVAAIKFSLVSDGKFRKSKEEKGREIKLIQESLTNSTMSIRASFPKSGISIIIYDFYSNEFLNRYTLIEYFLSTMKKCDIQKYLKDKDLILRTLKYFLHYPYQYQFMKIAQISFEIMNKDYFYEVIWEIISFIRFEKENFFLNYRQLLREFWIKSPPHLKKYVTANESRDKSSNSYIIQSLFSMKHFTSDDMQNVYLIVKEASPDERQSILRIQGKRVCNLLCERGNFKLVDFFLNILDLNKETLLTFKKEIAFGFFLKTIESHKMECVNDEFFSWVSENDETDKLKDEIFYILTHTRTIEFLFEKFGSGERFSFANQVIKFFLNTRKEFEEWKNNILNLDPVFSPFINYQTPKWFEEFFTYLHIAFKGRPEIKREILMINLPKIAKSIYEREFLSHNIGENILYLCSSEKERIAEFTDALRAFYNDSIKQEMCLLCMNKNLVSSNRDDSQCERHGTRGFISLNKATHLCYSFPIRIDEIRRDLHLEEISYNSNSDIPVECF